MPVLSEQSCCLVADTYPGPPCYHQNTNLQGPRLRKRALGQKTHRSLRCCRIERARLAQRGRTQKRASAAPSPHNNALFAAERSGRSGSAGDASIASTVTDPSNFKSGRDFAAWIGLVPRQHSTGGKERNDLSSPLIVKVAMQHPIFIQASPSR